MDQQLSEHVESTNRIELVIPWDEMGMTAESADHVAYIEKLTERYYDLLKASVDRILPNKMKHEKTATAVFHRGEYGCMGGGGGVRVYVGVGVCLCLWMCGCREGAL